MLLNHPRMSNLELERLVGIGYPRAVAEAARVRELPYLWAWWRTPAFMAAYFLILACGIAGIVGAFVLVQIEQLREFEELERLGLIEYADFPWRTAELSTWPLQAVLGCVLALAVTIAIPAAAVRALSDLEPLKVRLGIQMIRDLDPAYRGGKEKRYQRKRPPTERSILNELGRSRLNWRTRGPWIWAVGLAGSYVLSWLLVALS